MSGSKGIVVAEDMHVVLATAPIDINSAGASSDVWSMANHAHCSVIVMLGVTGGTATVTVEECDNFTPSNVTAIAFASYEELTAGGDTLGARTAVTSAGFTSSANDGVFYVFEIDASQLSDGRPNLRVLIGNPSNATLYGVVALLSGSRYAQPESATVIA